MNAVPLYEKPGTQSKDLMAQVMEDKAIFEGHTGQRDIHWRRWGARKNVMICVKYWRCALIAISAVAMSVPVVIALGSQATVDAEAAKSLVAGESFVYRFDPVSESFTFTFTVPGQNANPWDIIVVPGTGYLDIWFTESAMDRIGRLTYTDTNDYAFREYTLTAGSRPLNLTWGGGSIWFTAAEGDYIGRLEPVTGQIDEFKVTAGSYPADLVYTPDGGVWFTEMMADRIAHLIIESDHIYLPLVAHNVDGTPASSIQHPASSIQHPTLNSSTVTATEHYTVVEYFDDSLSGGRPYGIAAAGASVYFAQTANDRVTRFTPPNTWIHIYSLISDIPNEPYALTLDNLGGVWGTERAGNRISRYEYGTFPVVSPYSLSPSASLPTGIAVDANDYLWFTQWHAGQIGRLIPAGTPRKDYYPLPLAGLTPTGIAVDQAGYIWVLASSPHRVCLPVIIHSF